ncbi:DGQHR domain-containing protein [Vreelandella subterranea]|uniref:DGQHR domain-containing protein n=1 Tax=Vreelandella subterranea TaxID=416874 RepID=A0A1H9PKB2_9GAMM|nr:DGQHR domain-containing protein [Halomonas subterranea]SER48557.1 DGQHR domain-containing protein [Halomonas subterranea]
MPSAPPKTRTSKTSILSNVFFGCGFQEIKSEGIEFNFKGDASEFDYIFAFQNLIVICEETSGKSNTSEHFRKKQSFASLMKSDITEALEEYSEINKDLNEYLEENEYEIDDLEVKFLYYSSVKDTGASNTAPYLILTIDAAKYFDKTIKTIGKSAKFELLKFLNVKLADLGDQRIKGRSKNTTEDTFNAFALPSKQTNYPEGFLVVSFYVDPETLIERAYVLRRNGWEKPEVSYQRMLDSKKLKEMREHLSSDKKVYINNLIITLPSSLGIYINSGEERKKQIPKDEIKDVSSVEINLPRELSSIGIIDGQHRIYSYHEGSDSLEDKIKKVRKRQNLLVTGLIFPEDYDDQKRVSFEAELFLKINNTQKPVSSALRQEIETLVNPLSGLAIAKDIIDELSNNGALKGFLKVSVFDDNKLVATSSIVRYILKPLVDPDSKGANELFKLWSRSEGSKALDYDNREDYIRFCYSEINGLLLAAKIKMSPHRMWEARSNKGKGILSPTSVNGFLICLRELIANDFIFYDEERKEIKKPNYYEKLEGIDEFNFLSYTSSSWGNLGHKIYTTYFQ